MDKDVFKMPLLNEVVGGVRRGTLNTIIGGTRKERSMLGEKLKFVGGKFKSTFIVKLGDRFKRKIEFSGTTFNFMLNRETRIDITMDTDSESNIILIVKKNGVEQKTFNTGVKDSIYVAHMDLRCTLFSMYTYIKELEN